MQNGGPVSWCSKCQATVALSSTEAEYIALTLAAKEATWLRLFLTELRLVKAEDQHAKINVSEKNSSIQALKNNIRAGEEGGSQRNSTSSEGQATGDTFEPIVINESTDSISMKDDNQQSVSLAHNPVFHARTKYNTNSTLGVVYPFGTFILIRTFSLFTSCPTLGFQIHSHFRFRTGFM